MATSTDPVLTAARRQLTQRARFVQITCSTLVASPLLLLRIEPDAGSRTLDQLVTNVGLVFVAALAALAALTSFTLAAQRHLERLGQAPSWPVGWSPMGWLVPYVGALIVALGLADLARMSAAAHHGGDWRDHPRPLLAWSPMAPTLVALLLLPQVTGAGGLLAVVGLGLAVPALGVGLTVRHLSNDLVAATPRQSELAGTRSAAWAGTGRRHRQLALLTSAATTVLALLAVLTGMAEGAEAGDKVAGVAVLTGLAMIGALLVVLVVEHARGPLGRPRIGVILGCFSLLFVPFAAAVALGDLIRVRRHQGPEWTVEPIPVGVWVFSAAILAGLAAPHLGSMAAVVALASLTVLIHQLDQAAST